MSTVRVVVLALCCALAAACGSDYRAPRAPQTGREAAPLGRVFDVDVSLPHLVFPGRNGRGAHVSLRLELHDGTEPGVAGIEYVRATAAGEEVPVEDLSGGRTFVNEGDVAWSTGRIGPVRIAGATFEYMLDGTRAEEGWRISGASWESQSGLSGEFAGQRRHRFLVAGTDYRSPGRVVLVELQQGERIRASAPLTETSPDPHLATTRGAVFALNRLTYDTLQRLDPRDRFATAWTGGTGQGSNPQDVLLLDDATAYVSRFEPPFDDLAIIDPRRGAYLGNIELGALAENPDHTSRPGPLALADRTAFVALADIDRTFTRYGEGKLAVVQPETGNVVGSIPLGGRNPVSIATLRDAQDRAKLYVALAGIYPGLLPQELSGGVAVVDVANRAWERWALDDDDAGGNVSALALVSPRLGYVIVSAADYSNRVIAFDPAEAEVLRTVRAPAAYVPALAADSGGVLAIPEADFLDPRVCLFRVPDDPRGQETPLGCVAVVLPPASVVALD
ncbi:MAG: hypothetical protein KBD01_14290 [Acidobacteria bacterium]|nr:hypothetical protein [Acidobacteriota bacterium]